MERYNYRTAMKEDIDRYIEYNVDLDDWRGDREGLEEQLNDDLWTDDSVTGNGSGSYTFNRWEAEEYICHNLDLYEEAVQEIGEPKNNFDPKSMDVTIRCYLLGEVISEVLDELESEGAFDEEEEEDE